jgi:hypothetical protein
MFLGPLAKAASEARRKKEAAELEAVRTEFEPEGVAEPKKTTEPGRTAPPKG